MKVDLYTEKGIKSQTKAELPKEIFEIKPHEAALRQYVRVYQVNQRAGTLSTKTRSEVSGGGRKPWAQKGTGRARHGSTRSPIWVGGGITFGPRPRNFDLSFPKKMRDLAFKSALSQKTKDERVHVIDNFSPDKPQTSLAAALLKKIGVSAPFVLVLGEENPNAVRSFRNIPGSAVKQARTLNAYEVLRARDLIFTKDALSSLEERLGLRAKKALKPQTHPVPAKKTAKPEKKKPVVKSKPASKVKKAAAPKKKEATKKS